MFTVYILHNYIITLHYIICRTIKLLCVIITAPCNMTGLAMIFVQLIFI